MEIGDYLIKIRKLRGMSQEAVAEKMNVSRQSISLWENNSTTPTLDNLISLSEIYGVNLAILVGQTDYETSNETINQEISNIKIEKRQNILLKIAFITSFLLIILFAIPIVSSIATISVIILSIISMKYNKNKMNTFSLIMGITYFVASIFIYFNFTEIYSLIN